VARSLRENAAVHPAQLDRWWLSLRSMRSITEASRIGALAMLRVTRLLPT